MRASTLRRRNAEKTPLWDFLHININPLHILVLFSVEWGANWDER